MIVMCGKTWKLKGLWHKKEDATKYGYDFWYQYRDNVLISTEWGSPLAWWKGLDPERVKEGQDSLKNEWNSYAIHRPFTPGFFVRPAQR